MDALVLGGGYGTRLFGRYNKKTYFPKGLVKIKDKPCIEHVLETFSDSIIDRIIIETNNEGKPFYESWANKSRFKSKTNIFVGLDTIEHPSGVLNAISHVSSYYQFDNPILIIAPDNFFTKNQDGLIKDYVGGVRIATYTVNSLDDAKKYGVIELDSEKIISCVEKPSNPLSKIIRTSCEIWDPETLVLLSEWNAQFGPDKVGDFINYLIKKGINVESYTIRGQWMDIGNKDDLQSAREMI